MTNVIIACTMLYTPYPRCTMYEGACAQSWLGCSDQTENELNQYWCEQQKHQTILIGKLTWHV